MTNTIDIVIIQYWFVKKDLHLYVPSTDSYL